MPSHATLPGMEQLAPSGLSTVRPSAWPDLNLDGTMELDEEEHDAACPAQPHVSDPVVWQPLGI